MWMQELWAVLYRPAVSRTTLGPLTSDVLSAICIQLLLWPGKLIPVKRQWFYETDKNVLILSTAQFTTWPWGLKALIQENALVYPFCAEYKSVSLTSSTR